MADLTQIQLEAALAEQVYRRNANDGPITLDDLKVTPVTLSTLPSFFQSDGGSDGSTFYYTGRGFVGEVVQSGGVIYVVFRGTDISGDFPSGFSAVSGLDQTASDPSGVNDLGDLSNDILLGQGTAQQTQLDDALALTRAAQAAAGGQQVIVVGQSLGGGLAGLVSAIANVPAVAIDPAPFQKQLSVTANVAAFRQMGFSQPELLFPDDVSPDFFSNSDANQRKILQASGIPGTSIDQYFELATTNFGTYLGNLQSSLQIYSVTGEILSSALGLLASYFVGGATSFLAAQSRTQIDVGVSAGITESLTTAVSLHSPTLFNLLVRTEGTNKQFEDLLKGDEELRYSLLENQGISGPIDGQRADPSSGGDFGHSNVVSSGPAAGILYRALWKSVEDTGGFYDQFYARFGAWLSKGAVAQGISATAQSDQPSVHSGVVKLGLQIVRDSIVNGGVGAAGLNVFGAGDANGPSSGYVRISLGDITSTNPSQVEKLSSSSIAQAFGVRDINLFIEQQAELAFGSALTMGDLSYLSQTLGASRSEIALGTKALGRDPQAPWQLLVVQAGGSNQPFNYDAKLTGFQSDASASTVVIGGAGTNTIIGSSANDFLVGGDGKNTFTSGGGRDIIIGGRADDTYRAQSGPTNTDSVIFLGGSGTNTADYSDVSGPLNLTLSTDKDDNKIDQLIATATGAMDSFLGVQKFKLSNYADTLKIGAGATEALKVIKEIDAGANPVGTKDKLDLSAYGKFDFINGHLISGGVDVKVSNFEEITFSSAGEEIKGASDGMTIYTGKGQDRIELSHNGAVMIADADTDDRITSYGATLTGGVRYTQSEDTFAHGAHGEKYRRNSDGSLIIYDATGNQTWVSGFNFALDSSASTAGIYVIQITYVVVGVDAWTGQFLSAVSQLHAMCEASRALTGRIPNGYADPLVLDLDGDGIEISPSAANSAYVDLNRDGFAEHVGWVRGGDGVLVRDLNGNGKIDDIGEMFGNATTSGFSHLATLDGNGDGKVSALDDGLADFNGDGMVDASDTFDTLKVWIDGDEDGVTDAGELKSLDSLGIVSISVGSSPSTVDVNGSTISATGSFTRADGSTGTIADLQLADDNFDTHWLGDSTVSAAAAAKPDLKGAGTLTSLHIAMTLHPALIDVVHDTLPLLTTTNLTELRALVRPILQGWAAAVPVPASTPGKQLHDDFHIVASTTLSGATVYDFLIARSDANGTYYGYASGQAVKDAEGNTIERPTMAQVLDSVPQHGNWIVFDGADISFLERYYGQAMPLDLTVNPGPDAIAAVSDLLTIGWNEINELAVRLAAQGPLAPFFAGISYDPATDLFRPTTEHQLVPMLEAIFNAAPVLPETAKDYIAQWRDIIEVMLPDFKRDDDGRIITNPYLFQNIVGAYENTTLPLTIREAAAIFNIAPEYIKTGAGTVTGSDAAEMFYLDATDQTLLGGAGQDSYVVGANFGHDVIQDVWQGLGDNQEDSLRFAHLNIADLDFARDGLDLVITEIGTDNQIRIVDEFAGRRPGLVTEFQDFDKQIEIITFADGTVWDSLDIARKIGMPSHATDDTLIGTPSVDFLNGGAGTDYMSGGDAGDHYLFGRGDGADTIEEKQTYTWMEAPDFVHFGAGISLSDLSFQRVGDTENLQITITGTGDVLTVVKEFNVDYGLLNTTPDRIEYFTFADGSYTDWETVLKGIDASAGTDGNDVIYGFDYADVLDAGKGDDYISGGNDEDTYIFGRGYGHDTIEDHLTMILSGGHDSVQFKADTAPGDISFHRVADSDDLQIVIDGTTDQLTVKGQFHIDYGLIWTMGDRIEEFTFADGTVIGWNDIIEQFDARAGTDGDDTIYGFSYADTLRGGKGDDALAGGREDDTYIYTRGDGHDAITEVADAQAPAFDTLVLHGIAPADVSLVRDGNHVTLVFAESAVGAGDGGSVLLKNELDDWFAQSVEQIVFDDGTIWTQDDLRVSLLAQASTAGNDSILGFNTNDVITGGLGDDTLTGAAGDDTYIYARGDGNDVIIEGAAGNFSTFDTLVLHGIAPADVSLVRDGNDVTLMIAASPAGGDAGSILLKNEVNDFFSTGVERIVFADGTVWTQAQIRTMLISTAGTPGDDIINGSSSPDIIAGGQGNDTINGGAGDDTYLYTRGDGNDVITEDPAGNFSTIDTLILQGIAPAAVSLMRGGNNNDVTLVFAESTPGAGDGGSILLKNSLDDYFSTGVERITFDDGTVWTQADLRTRLLAEATASNASAIYGFNVTDTIVAGLGDRYLNGRGGNDTYIYTAAGGNDVVDDGGPATLVMQDIASSGVTLSRPGGGDSLVLTVTATGKTITLPVEFGQWNAGGVIVSFADGVSWDKAQLQQMLLDIGSAANGGAVYGYGGRNDTIIAGLGDKYLNGYSGNDTYVYTSSGGNDVVDDDSGTLVMQDIASSGVTLVRPVGSDDLVIINSATGRTVTLRNEFNPFNAGALTVNFSDGVSWDKAQLLGHLSTTMFLGTAGGETIDGSADADTIDGRGGNDRLVGHAGNDSYVYGVGSGNDTIAEGGAAADGNADRVKLVGLNSADVQLDRAGNDLIVQIKSSGETLKVENQFVGDQGIEQIVFANGTTWDRAQIVAVVSTIRGTSAGETINGTSAADIIDGGGGDDVIYGGEGGDTYLYRLGSGNDRLIDYYWYSGTDVAKLEGLNTADVQFSRTGDGLFITIAASGERLAVDGQFSGYGLEQVQFANGTVWDRNQIAAAAWTRGTSGNDTINGSSGDDIIDGGAGDDVISGGDGGDTYVYRLGSGNDHVIDYYWFSGTDVAKLEGLNTSDVQFSRSGNGVVITIAASGETLSLDGQIDGYGVEQVQFANGTVWDRNQIAAAAWTRGTSGNDTINGSAAAETFDGGAGDDVIYGGDGGDTYVYRLGSGNDHVIDYYWYGGTDVARLEGLNASDVLFSRTGNGVVITIAASGETLSLDGQIDGYGVEQVAFADGTVWDRTAISDATSSFTFTGSSTNATLVGNAYGFNTFQFGDGAEAASGGARNNLYQVSAGTGDATINLPAAAGSKNELDFTGGITDHQLWFAQSGNDLVIDLIGTQTDVTIKDWFAGGSSHMQEIVAGGLKIDSQVSQLVQAMATYSAANSGFDPTASSLHAVPNDAGLQSAMAAAWHA